MEIPANHMRILPVGQSTGKVFGKGPVADAKILYHLPPPPVKRCRYLHTGPSLGRRPRNALQGWLTLGWPGRADLGPTLRRLWVDVGLTLGRLCVDFGSTLDRLWLDVGSTLGRHWVDCGSTVGRSKVDLNSTQN